MELKVHNWVLFTPTVINCVIFVVGLHDFVGKTYVVFSIVNFKDIKALWMNSLKVDLSTLVHCFNPNLIFVFSFRNASADDQCSPDEFDQSALVDCHEWVYDRKDYLATFMAEINIVCDESWKGPLSQSMYFTGVLVILTITCSIHL